MCNNILSYWGPSFSRRMVYTFCYKRTFGSSPTHSHYSHRQSWSSSLRNNICTTSWAKNPQPPPHSELRFLGIGNTWQNWSRKMEGLQEWITALLSMPCGKSTSSHSFEIMKKGEERAAQNRPRCICLIFRYKLKCNMFYEVMATYLCIFLWTSLQGSAEGVATWRDTWRAAIVVKAGKPCLTSERKPCAMAGTIWPKS